MRLRVASRNDTRAFPPWPKDYPEARIQVWTVTDVVRRLTNLRSGCPDSRDTYPGAKRELENRLFALVPTGYYTRRSRSEGLVGYGVYAISWSKSLGAYTVFASIYHGPGEGKPTTRPLLGEMGLVHAEAPDMKSQNMGGPTYFLERAHYKDVLKTLWP